MSIRAELEVVSGPGSGTVIALNEPRFLIGRERDCQLRLESPLVSRHHVVIKRDDFMLRVRDMGSRNGSFVNGRKVVGEVVLNDGDTLQFGDVTALVRISETEKGGRKPTPGGVDAAAQSTSVYDGGTIVSPPQGYPPQPVPQPTQGYPPAYQPQYAPPPPPAPPPGYYPPPAPAYGHPPPVMYPGYPPGYAVPPQPQPYYPPPAQPYPPPYPPR